MSVEKKLEIPEAEENVNRLSITTTKRTVMIYSVLTMCLAICLYYAIESSSQPWGCRNFYPNLRGN